MYEDVAPIELLEALGATQRAVRSDTFRTFALAGRLAQHRIAGAGEDAKFWCIDGWEAVAAEVGAELGLSRGRAGSLVHHGLTLLERLPRLLEVGLRGDVEGRVYLQIEFRTGLITDPEILAKIDEALAQRAPQWNALSDEKVVAQVDWLVVALDPEAQRVARDRDDDRHVDVNPNANGMADLSGKLRAADGAVVNQRLDEVAATVCPRDPRTARQRRADAILALAEGATTLACTCESDCSAAGASDATPSQVVVHVIADAATVSGDGDTPGYVTGFGAVPAETVRKLATKAKVRPVIRPKDFTSEPQYRPSRALADFLRCRDLTCRFPGCAVPAERCDIDHTVPYPVGPTHPSNCKLYCRPHHLLKTFYTGVGGWSEVQSPDGTMTWTAPSGRTYVTKPDGALFFPQLSMPGGELIRPTGASPPTVGRSLAMPTRRRTRVAERAAKIEWERGLNRARMAADPPPF